MPKPDNLLKTKGRKTQFRSPKPGNILKTSQLLKSMETRNLHDKLPISEHRYLDRVGSNFRRSYALKIPCVIISSTAMAARIQIPARTDWCCAT